jgi:uncharacterized membrane protein
MASEDALPDAGRAREHAGEDQQATSDGNDTARALQHQRLQRRFTAAGLLLGVGLGGFVDGIVLHQILQWHHMLTDYGSATFPASTVRSLEDNSVWDGLFHLSTWLFVTVGVFLLWRVLSAGYQTTRHGMVGLLLAGWGIFNLIEGIVDHHLLTVHHVRDDVADPLWWDVGFLAFGALLVVAGLGLRRRDVVRSDQTATVTSATSRQISH